MKKKKAPKRKVYKTKLEVVNIKMQLPERKAIEVKAKLLRRRKRVSVPTNGGPKYIPTKK